MQRVDADVSQGASDLSEESIQGGGKRGWLLSLQECLVHLAGKPVSLDPAQLGMVGWLPSWTCWHAHKLVKLCSCLRTLMSALCQEGVTQGQQLHMRPDTCIAQVGQLGFLDLAFAITIDAAPWYCHVWQSCVTPSSSCDGVGGCFNVAADSRPHSRTFGWSQMGQSSSRTPRLSDPWPWL